MLDRTDTGPVAHLRLNAPERLNALSDEMIAALHGEFDRIRDQSEIRAVVLSGAGKAFCAGHDLKQMTQGRQAEDGGRAYFADLFARCAAMMTAIRDLPQPVIAQVHGIAT
ncbi:MAG: enoyl-CoA hydratase/isomerase family protein, partial [Pseudooceanicola sp.]|nr:enoyl-CoA hydratase/isomerase family protein [Pseudooceanicola sp.]